MGGRQSLQASSNSHKNGDSSSEAVSSLLAAGSRRSIHAQHFTSQSFSSAAAKRRLSLQKSLVAGLTTTVEKSKFFRAGRLRHALLFHRKSRTITGSLHLPTAVVSEEQLQRFRDVVMIWPHSDLCELVEQYNQLTILRNLARDCAAVRPLCDSDGAERYRELLACNKLPSDTLFYDSLHAEYGFPDVILHAENRAFACHRALLACRSRYFWQLFCNDSRMSTAGSVAVPAVTADNLDRVLQVLYTSKTLRSLPKKVVSFFGLSQQLYMSSDLHSTSSHKNADIRYTQLWKSTVLSDCTLLIEEDDEIVDQLPCHSCVLFFRCSYFRRVLTMLYNSAQANTPIEGEYGETHCYRRHDDGSFHFNLVIDGEVMPAKYARLLLQYFYTNTLDEALLFSLDFSLSPPDQMPLARPVDSQPFAPADGIKRVMNLYQLAKFLDVESLARACEDLIWKRHSIEHLPMILEWATNSWGSRWLYRKCMVYLEENFTACSAVILELDQALLLQLLKSDFAQATEEQIFTCVVRWGEREYYRRLMSDQQSVPLLWNSLPMPTYKRIIFADRCSKYNEQNGILEGKSWRYSRSHARSQAIADIISDLLSHVRLEHFHLTQTHSSNQIIATALKKNYLPESCMELLNPTHNYFHTRPRSRASDADSRVPEIAEENHASLPHASKNGSLRVRCPRLVESLAHVARQVLLERGHDSAVHFTWVQPYMEENKASVVDVEPDAAAVAALSFHRQRNRFDAVKTCDLVIDMVSHGLSDITASGVNQPFILKSSANDPRAAKLISSPPPDCVADTVIRRRPADPSAGGFAVEEQTSNFGTQVNSCDFSVFQWPAGIDFAQSTAERVVAEPALDSNCGRKMRPLKNSLFIGPVRTRTCTKSDETDETPSDAQWMSTSSSVVDKTLETAMLARFRELYAVVFPEDCPEVMTQNSILPSSSPVPHFHRRVQRYIMLRVVREFDLPDAFIDVLDCKDLLL